MYQARITVKTGVYVLGRFSPEGILNALCYDHGVADGKMTLEGVGSSVAQEEYRRSS